MYGLDNYILNPPYSFLISLILFSGVIFIGSNLNKFIFIKILNLKYKSNFIFFSPLSGSYILLLICYLIIILNLMSIGVIKIISNTILILGIINIFIYIIGLKKKFSFKFRKLIISKEYFLVISILILLFLISASPVTHSDSLNYHIGGAINILNTGEFIHELLPMIFHLVSVGEVLIAIGLSVGAEQFGGIIQFSSILSLIPLFSVFNSKEKFGLYFFLILITTPILIFLISSPKPQILFMISSSIIFFTSMTYISSLCQKHLKLFFTLSFIVLNLNFLAKYSFLLSSFLIGSILFLEMFKRRLLIYSISNFILIFFILTFPYLYKKQIQFDYSIISQIITGPLPINIYGFQKFHNIISIGELTFLQLIIPKSLGEFSTIYGPSLILIFLLINKNLIKKIEYFVIVILFLIISFFQGSNLPRFLFEGFVWMNLLVFTIINQHGREIKLFKIYTLCQSIFILIILLFFAVKLFPGSISKNLRDTVMNENANGQLLANWTNRQLKKGDVLISKHSSISLFNVKTFSPIFTWAVNFKEAESIKYANFIKNANVNRILFYGKTLDTVPFSKCLGKLIKYEKNVGIEVGRNPFNKGKKYDAWLFEFNNKELPYCLSPT